MPLSCPEAVLLFSELGERRELRTCSSMVRAYVQMLQEESGVSLNAVESVDKFVCDVQHGKWDEVLKTAALTSLKEETQQMLYEQVCLRAEIPKGTERQPKDISAACFRILFLS